MVDYSISLRASLPGGPRSPSEVEVSLRNAGSTAVGGVGGGPRIFDIEFEMESASEDEAVWAAMCDISLAFPGAVLVAGGQGRRT